jgi:hypothetical protein
MMNCCSTGSWFGQYNLVWVLFMFISVSPAVAQSDANAIIGRWDMTFNMNGTERPGWLEVELSGNSTLVGRVMVVGGSARPIAEVAYRHGSYRFSIPKQWERGDYPLAFECTLSEDVLNGTLQHADGNRYSWRAVRAPWLYRTSAPVWGESISLFNGKDLNGWTTQNPGDRNQWRAEGGVLRCPEPGANLRTVDTFDDFRLHIEFRYPENGNSGVYLRGRYEVQVADSKGKHPESHLFSGIYGLLDPSVNVAKAPGEWQSFDITLVGRMVTVIANGVTVICNQEIPGITGGAIDSREEEPGPILLQGDHQPVEYRNILLTPAK